MRKAILVLVIIILWLPPLFTALKFLSEKEIIKMPDLVLKFDRRLSGVIVIPKDPDLSIKNLLDGTFQKDVDTYFNHGMYGRPTMTRIYNQILYSLFYSPNTTQVVMGKGKQLFELAYPLAYLKEVDDNERTELFDQLSSLALLQKRLEEMGKLLLVLVSPSKVSIYTEGLPNDFARYASMKAAGEYSQNMYECFLSSTEETGLQFFDYHDGFLDLKKNGMHVYPNGGIHWTGPAAATFFQEALKVINNTGRNVGTVQTIKAEPVWGNAFLQDDDLEDILNLLFKYNSLPPMVKKILPFYRYLFPRDQFISYHMESLSIPTDYRPSVFVCGDSSCWYWLYMLFGLKDWVTQGEASIFDSLEYSWYNTHVTKYPGDIRIAENTDDYHSILSKDIIIVSLNEANVRPNCPQLTFAINLLNFILENEGE